MRRVLGPLVLALALPAVGATPTWAGTANGGLPGAPAGNPLAGMTWGLTRADIHNPAKGDPPSAYYNSSRGRDRRALGFLVGHPRFQWFGSWIATHRARAVARNYIRSITHGNSRVGVGITIFRLEPFEGKACRVRPSRGQIADYKRWIRNFAKGIGKSRVALVLQPDMPFALCLPGHSPIDLQLVSFSARVFNALPHTTVYIDAGGSDYLSVGRAASMLARAGVRGVRGFALNMTHVASTPDQVRYGRKLVAALAHRGIKDRHFVVNTAANGHPYAVAHHRGAFRAGKTCATKRSHVCISLGHPFTTDTGAAAGDAFVWAGRSWLNGSRRRTKGDTLRLIRSSPFF
ncbi:MAG TPA: glycoside hydrolase family 6 protein [Solirubrobacteraceae bacterium]